LFVATFLLLTLICNKNTHLHKRKDQAVTPVKGKGKAGAHIYTPLHLVSLNKRTTKKTIICIYSTVNCLFSSIQLNRGLFWQVFSKLLAFKKYFKNTDLQQTKYLNFFLKVQYCEILCIANDTINQPVFKKKKNNYQKTFLFNGLPHHI